VYVVCNSFIKMLSLVSEMCTFKDHHLVSKVARAENNFVFCTRGGQSSDKQDYCLK